MYKFKHPQFKMPIILYAVRKMVIKIYEFCIFSGTVHNFSDRVTSDNAHSSCVCKPVFANCTTCLCLSFQCYVILLSVSFFLLHVQPVRK